MIRTQSWKACVRISQMTSKDLSNLLQMSREEAGCKEPFSANLHFAARPGSAGRRG